MQIPRCKAPKSLQKELIRQKPRRLIIGQNHFCISFEKYFRWKSVYPLELWGFREFHYDLILPVD
jgi:hypothetical protein